MRSLRHLWGNNALNYAPNSYKSLLTNLHARTLITLRIINSEIIKNKKKTHFFVCTDTCHLIRHVFDCSLFGMVISWASQ